MSDPDSANLLRADNLQRLVDEVRREFFDRRAREVGTNYEQVNSVRLVTIEVYDRLAAEAQAAIASDIVCSQDEIALVRDPADIFRRSDTPQAHIADLICEIVYQQLLNEPAVAMENEYRETQTD
jgi:hypothetical protein